MQTAFQADQVTVTGTGYFGAARREVRQLAWRLGAAYCGDLMHGVTTHLVCKDAAQPITEKVKMAEAWGIPVVDHSWLLDSVARQVVLLPEKYALVPPSILAKSVPPATVTARSSKHRTAKHLHDKQLVSSRRSQSHAADNEDIELLRAADSPTNCQLADLLLSTTLSPASGAKTFVKGNAKEQVNPENLSPGMPPPSPASAALSTPEFSIGTASLASAPQTTAVSDVHWEIKCSPPQDSTALTPSSFSRASQPSFKHSNASFLGAHKSSPDLNSNVAAPAVSIPDTHTNTLPTTSNLSFPAITLHASPLTTPAITSPTANSGPRAASSNDHDPDQDDSAWAGPSKQPFPKARSPAVDVVGLHPLKKVPRGNSVKQYHGLHSMHGVTFYQALEVTDEYGTRHCFDVRDKTQGALVYYEDLDNGDRMEAYCNLVHCYSLPDDQGLWVEHGYFDDREDLQSLPMGRALLQHTAVQEHELLARPGLWHSRGQVIEGTFTVLPSRSEYRQHGEQQAVHDGKDDLFWCDKTWDPAAGQVLKCDLKPEYNRKSCSLSSRFILA
ncbi:TPA: hypothetical protein ACH3X2_012009 [Trebouxia sp. C0005]